MDKEETTKEANLWWWDDEANTAIQRKRKCWKEWRNGGVIPTREVRKIVHVPKKFAEE